VLHSDVVKCTAHSTCGVEKSATAGRQHRARGCVHVWFSTICLDGSHLLDGAEMYCTSTLCSKRARVVRPERWATSGVGWSRGRWTLDGEDWLTAQQEANLWATVRRSTCIFAKIRVSRSCAEEQRE